MTMTQRLMAVVAACFLCLPVSVHASSISVQVDGVVTLVDDDDGLLPMPVTAGDAWRITYVISSIAPPNSCAPWLLSGCFYGAIESMTSTIAGISYTLLPAGEFSNYQVSSNADFYQDGDDRWSVHAISSEGPVPPPELHHSMGVTLFGPGDSALVVDASYLPVPDFSFANRSIMSFGATRFFEDLSYDTDGSIRGRVTSITQVVDVPGPSTFWLLGIGLFGLLAAAVPRSPRAVSGWRRTGIPQRTVRNPCSSRS